MKNLFEDSRIKIGGLLRVQKPQPLWKLGQIREAHVRKKMVQKNPTLLQKLKELAAEAENDEEILSDLSPQVDSEISDESRYHITTNYTVIPVLSCQTGYTIPTIVRSLPKSPRKKDRYDKKNLGAIGKSGF